jgi:hypothetical protein
VARYQIIGIDAMLGFERIPIGLIACDVIAGHSVSNRDVNAL